MNSNVKLLHIKIQDAEPFDLINPLSIDTKYPNKTMEIDSMYSNCFGDGYDVTLKDDYEKIVVPIYYDTMVTVVRPEVR